MSAEREEVFRQVMSDVTEHVDGAMRDGAEVAFKMSIDLARSLATKVPQVQSDVLVGYADALEQSAAEFLARIERARA